MLKYGEPIKYVKPSEDSPFHEMISESDLKNELFKGNIGVGREHGYAEDAGGTAQPVSRKFYYWKKR